MKFTFLHILHFYTNFLNQIFDFLHQYFAPLHQFFTPNLCLLLHLFFTLIFCFFTPKFNTKFLNLGKNGLKFFLKWRKNSSALKKIALESSRNEIF